WATTDTLDTRARERMPGLLLQFTTTEPLPKAVAILTGQRYSVPPQHHERILRQIHRLPVSSPQERASADSDFALGDWSSVRGALRPHRFFVQPRQRSPLDDHERLPGNGRPV